MGLKLLDTTVLVDFLREEETAVKAIGNVHGIITEINAFEHLVGEFLYDRQNHHPVRKLLSRMDVLPLDRKATIEAASLSAELIKKGKPIGDADSLIAGIARANGVKEIVSRDKHFERAGLKRVDY